MSLIDAVYKAGLKQPEGLVAKYDDAPELNSVQQADTLFLPEDKTGYKYALVVVDNATRRTAARALKNKSTESVLEAFKSIYKEDKFLKWPKRLEIDQGKEFGGIVKEAFEDHNTFIRHGEPGRHRQQARVEGLNKIIGKAIFKKLSMREVLTGEPEKNWVRYLQPIITEINDKLQREPPPIPDDLPKPANEQDKEILVEGTRVRRILDRPQDSFGKPLSYSATKTGRRATDTNYEIKIRTIVTQLIRPPMGIRYILSGLPDVSYARYELQVLEPAAKKKAKKPIDAFRLPTLEEAGIDPDEPTAAENIHEARGRGLKREYLVSERGKDKPVWRKLGDLFPAGQKMAAAFDSSNLLTSKLEKLKQIPSKKLNNKVDVMPVRKSERLRNRKV